MEWSLESVRSRADCQPNWLPCHHGGQTRRPCSRYLTSLLHRQTSNQECVLQRATSIQEADMRRRWHLSPNWKPRYRRLFSAKAILIQSSNIDASRSSNPQHQKASTHFATNRLRSLRFVSQSYCRYPFRAGKRRRRPSLFLSQRPR